MRKEKGQRKKSVLIYRMHFLLILFHSFGMLLLTVTLLMALFLVSAYIVLTLISNEAVSDFTMIGAFLVCAGLIIALWFIVKRFIKQKRKVEGLIVKMEEQEFDEGRSFFVYTMPGEIKSEINEKAFRKLKKGDRIILSYFRLVEDAVSVRKI